MTAEIEFVDELPLKPRNHKYDHASIAKQLKARPGEWALILKGVSPATAFQIRAGGYRAYPAGEFDARPSNHKNNRADIYARYIGGAA